MLFSLENANKWINKIELKLSNPDNVLEQSNLAHLSLNIQRIVNDLNVRVYWSKLFKFLAFLVLKFLKEAQNLLKSKQEIINKIRELCEQIAANKSRLKHEICNLKEILELAEEIKQRYRNIFIQISDRYLHSNISLKINL